VLHARLLLRAGEVAAALRQYRRAIELDPALTDPYLAEQLGVRPEVRPSESARAHEERLPAAWEEPSEPLAIEVERPAVSFRDVGGMETLKDEIRLKIIHPLTHAELYRAYGKPIGGGILMYGPPGCGKTHLARATAGEISASFLAVGIDDVLDMWIGLAGVALALFGQPGGAAAGLSSALVGVTLIGAFASQWIANGLIMARPGR
jgi:SpoVK/Ycf46/Vps4 family AAA+-type ATPase